ncbi:Ig-like domain repeat protein [Bryocella elongata]|nr:Ig-like domain repeat protein [Bryocella elongata]
MAQSGLVISQIFGGGGNAGAPYSNDYIEIYNPTSAAISLAGLSVQYASSTGTAWQATPLGSSSLAAGQYFLVQEAKGSGTFAALPTPDATGTINLSGTTGKVALVNSTTALSGACPMDGVLDLVGFGTANCYSGSGDAPTLSNSTAALRSSYTNNNSADFTAATPNPRNTSYGSSSAGISAAGAANPSTVTSGGSTLLTVTVTPGTAPSSTGITVTADLSGIGGSATQAFYDDGTHGDVTAGDNVFSFSTTAISATSKTYSLSASVADTQLRNATASIGLTVNLPASNVAIHVIQGQKSLTATTVSPYAGQTVTTQGIVTGVSTAGFFIQTPDSDIDADPLTPEGIYVYTGSGKVPSTAVIGNYVRVTGAISTYPAVSASHTPATELSSTTATVLATGQTLPKAIALTASMLTPSGGLYQLTPYEGMRVSVNSLTSVSGTDGSLSSEANETTTSNGQFYAVITGTPRPFREPGVDIRDSQTGLPANVAHFDDNPERILVDTSLLGGTKVDLSTGAVLPSVTGVLDFTYSSDSYYDPSRLALDATYDRSQVVAGIGVVPAPAPASNEFRVAAYNIERFFNTNSADDIDYNPVTQKTGNSSAVDLTAAAYANRLSKVSLAVRHVLGNPDVVALEEVENQSVVADIAAKISSDATAAGETDPQYVAYGTGTSYAPYTNDVGGISVGFLVKSTTVNTINVQQFGASNLFTDPRDNTTQQTLNDRPPLVLHAGIKRTNAKDYPVTVIVNHLRSLSGENDPSSGVFVRAKKELQAEYLANLIQGYQSSGEHVISVGDYNAFQFSDAYIDILATVTNRNVLPSDQVLVPGIAGLVNPSPTDLVTLLPAADQWSYQEYGNAQVLDHIVATSDLVGAGAHVAYAHFDADQPLIAYNDPTTPARESDHDAAVGYFATPAPVLSATLTGTGSFGTVNEGTSSSAMGFILTNTGEGSITISGITASGDFTQNNQCGATLLVNATCSINVIFTPTAAGARTGTLTITTNTGTATYTANLTGNGSATTTTLSLSAPTPVAPTVGQPVSITATVAGTGATPTGTVTFVVDGAAQSPITTTAGVATISLSGLAAGSHSVSASYNPTANFTASTASAVSFTVKATPSLALSVSPAATSGNELQGVGLTFTATLSAASKASGTVSFFDGATQLTSGIALNGSGVATYSTSTLGLGAHSVTAQFVGDSLNVAATSSAVAFTTKVAASAGITSSTPSLYLSVAAPGTTTATLSYVPNAGYAGTLTLSCSGLPSGVTCGFSPASLTFTQGSTASQSSTLTITVAAQHAMLEGAPRRGQSVYFAMLFPGLLGLWKLRKNRNLASRLLMLAMLFGGFLMVTGCGGGNKVTSSAFNVVASDGTNSVTTLVNLTIH